MLNMNINEAAEAVAASNHKMTRKDLMELVRFGLGVMIVPAMVTGLSMMNLFA